MWVDYSQNINFVEKKQVQSANYSGKQHTLHNAVIFTPNGEVTYIYYLSDNTNHDSVLTFTVLESIIEAHPEVIEKKFLCLRSDNCGDQYKCRFVFHKMKMCAQKYGITVVWMYGTQGRGRGLVDAMAWFGCKQPLKKDIITNDSWFDTAGEMTVFLKSHFDGNNSKEYYCIEPNITAEKRSTQQEERILKPCIVYRF